LDIDRRSSSGENQQAASTPNDRAVFKSDKLLAVEKDFNSLADRFAQRSTPLATLEPLLPLGGVDYSLNRFRPTV
jgi:hypothetical protein